MKVTALDLPGLLLIEPKRIGDRRGWFSEVWQEQRYRDAGIAEHFVQDNLATSQRGVLRGLHAQEPFAQGKLVQVLSGRVFDVAVDARVGSPTFGRWHGLFLDGDTPLQYYVPPGFLHGYCVVSEHAMFSYKTTDVYSPEHQFAVRWDDPAIGIDWPLQTAPLLSEKDAAAPLLADIPAARLSRF
ncbi:MAG: dTDP-4-dehydrorhamnose 3,5-epimerase [Gammaproteobacteria bacterium]|nr:dTDP-4-dehydrorhamnose 3,5-epimerase [Gammaproteobacteria bacterium]